MSTNQLHLSKSSLFRSAMYAEAVNATTAEELMLLPRDEATREMLVAILTNPTVRGLLIAFMQVELQCFTILHRNTETGIWPPSCNFTDFHNLDYLIEVRDAAYEELQVMARLSGLSQWSISPTDFIHIKR